MSIILYTLICWCFNINHGYLWQPEKIYAWNTSNIVLRVVAHTANVTNAADRNIATVTIRTFQYGEQAHFIGPTIVARPNDTVHVTLVNDLVGVGRASKINELVPGATLGTEGYKDPDVVNLHTHGLHVSPLVDDILLWTSPHCPRDKGLSLEDLQKLDCFINDTVTPNVKWTQDYPYSIPPEHYPGTHWYHAHWHGSVTFDVIQGLYGMFIIEEKEENEMYKPDMEDIQLLIGYAWLHDYADCMDVTQNFKSCAGPYTKYRRPADTDPLIYPFQFPIQSACLVYCTMASTQAEAGLIPLDGNYYTQANLSAIGEYPVSLVEQEDFAITGENGTELFLVNGQVQPIISMSSDKWYRLQIVNTVMNYLLFWVKDDSVEYNCKVNVMGRDGIYFNESRQRSIYHPPYKNKTVVIPPGSRADIAVQCDCDNENSEPCTYAIYGASTVQPDEFIPVPLKDHVLFRMEVNHSDNEADPNTFDLWKPQPHSMTPYLAPTIDLDSTQYEAYCAQGNYSSEDMSQCNIVHGRQRYGNKTNVAMNQLVFSHDKSTFKVCTGRTREWTVTTNWHPFHHHTWPLQLQTDVSDGWIATQGDWRDTIGAPGTIRMRSNYINQSGFRDGALIMHCHFVPHEDHGMMVQVALEPEESDICDQEYRQYIIPHKNVSDIEPEPADPFRSKCIYRTATSNITLKDVNAQIQIGLTLTTDCSAKFDFSIKPRTSTVGNLWIGMGFEPISWGNTRFNISRPNANPVTMQGNALIVSLLANDDGGDHIPLATVTQMEVELNDIRNTPPIHGGNYFDCDGLTDNLGVKKFTCTRPQCNDTSTPFCNLNVDRSFIIAYGEGQFRHSETYHSSRGGCAYSFEDTVQCYISQGQVNYNFSLTLPPSSSPTITYTTGKPTEYDESLAYRISCHVNIGLICGTFAFCKFML